MAPTLKIKVVEESLVSPPPDSTPELSLPLTFFDIPWIDFHHMQALVIYSIPNSMTEVLETIIPHLKTSLSLTLKHFLPVAGNLLLPSDSGRPELHYRRGDAVRLVVAESDHDFNFLTGYHPRKADEFHPLFQDLPRFVNASSPQKLPVLALQVTVFPNSGLTVGITFNHGLGDGICVTAFTKLWTCINQLRKQENQAELLLPENLLPCFDRSFIKGAGERQTQEAWREKVAGNVQLVEQKTANYSHSEKFRASYLITRETIDKMKKLVLKIMPELVHVSSFMLSCAYVWTCIVKSRTATGENVDDANETEYFCFAADCRALLNPPLPENYFGNCLVPLVAKVVHAELVGNEGFFKAGVAIGKVIRKLLHNEGKSFDNSFFISEFQKMNPLRSFGVSGSPKGGGYEADFGWGNPVKYEFVSIDHDGVMSLMNNPGKCGGSLEVGLSLPHFQMEAFANFFNEGLRILAKI